LNFIAFKMNEHPFQTRGGHQASYKRGRGRGRGRGGGRGWGHGQSRGRGSAHDFQQQQNTTRNQAERSKASSKRKNPKTYYTQNFVQQIKDRRRRQNNAYNRGGTSFHSNLTVKVSNFPPDTNPVELVNFLSQTAQVRIDARNIKYDSQTPMLLIWTHNHEEASALRRLEGKIFRQRPLNIESIQRSRVVDLNPQLQSQLLTPIISAAYNSSKNFLDLTNVRLNNEYIEFEFHNPAFMNALFRVVKDICPNVKFLIFANNSIKYLRHFQQMANYLPNVEGLSFENNDIENFEELAHLAELRLIDVVFANNPIAAKPNYRLELKRRFPQLRFLDREEIHAVIQLNISPDSMTLQKPKSRGSFFDCADTNEFTHRFIKQFIDYYDNNRVALLDLYDGGAYFSLTIAVPQTYPKRQLQNMKNYFKFDRNFNTNAIEIRKKRLFTVRNSSFGTQGNIMRFQDLPKTTHDISSFVYDAFLLPIMADRVKLICISFHGQYRETNEFGEFIRFFSRVLIVALTMMSSSPPQYRAVILNDLLTIRPMREVSAEMEQENNVNIAQSGPVTTTTVTNVNPSAIPFNLPSNFPSAVPALNFNAQVSGFPMMQPQAPPQQGNLPLTNLNVSTSQENFLQIFGAIRSLIAVKCVDL